MNPIAQGLSISLLGLTTTFIALGLLVVLILLLTRLFPIKPDFISGETQTQEEERVRAVAAATAVAVAVSLVESEGETHPGLGELLEEPPGRWWYRRGLPEP